MQLASTTHKYANHARVHEYCAREHAKRLVDFSIGLCCDQGVIGDEYHVVFQCPATRAARAPFAHLFPCGTTMLAFSRNPDTLTVAKCILACLDEVNLITTRPLGPRP